MESAIAMRPCPHLLVYDAVSCEVVCICAVFSPRTSKDPALRKMCFGFQMFEMSRIAPKNAAGVVAVQKEMVFGELQPG
jgi:hypothetical protein